MSRAQAESVIKNIIREIAQQCAAQKHALSETLVAFMVKAVVLHPENGFNVDRILTKDDVHKLIKLCVEKLLDTDSPSLETVKMQVYFDMNYTTRSEFLEEHRRVLESRLLPVIREITDSRARTRDELESLYRKIVTAVLLRSGLGSPTDIAVVREATAALQSVFPQSELSTFMSLNKKDKERQILELTMICTGIRLFNKECGKGGEGIDDLPAILNAAVPQTTHNVESLIKETMDYVHKYTAMLEKLYSIKPAEEPPIPVARQALINVRQLLTYLHVILNDIINCAKQVEFLENELSSRLEQLQATVQFKTAVPTAQVYPQFINLSQLWSGLQDEMVLLSVLSNIMASLHPFSKVHKTIFTNEMVTSLLEGVVVKTDEERLGTCGPEYCIDAKDFPNLEWLFPEAIKNFHKLQLQYKGYCGWALAKFDRLLLPANPNIGILKYKGFYYIFSSKQAAYEFAANPEYFIQLIGEGAKRSPELIQLLELQAQFSALSPYTQSKDGTCLIEKPITKCDSGTQTDTHFIESNIVKSYEWNEWELRRKAIKLANLRRRVTHSIQTNLSNTKRDSVTQVYPPKEVGMQTKRDSYSNVPKPHTFLAGLRGCGLPNPTVMTKFDLTLDVDQD